MAGYSVTLLMLQADGADILSPDKGGVTPLHLYCGEGHLDIVKKMVRRSEDGAALVVEDDRGFTPCDWALGCGRQEAAEWLQKQQEMATVQE